MDNIRINGDSIKIPRMAAARSKILLLRGMRIFYLTPSSD
jgi:hypothetical protein